MKIYIFLLLTLSTVSYAMESNEFPSLKTLAVLTVARNYKQFETQIKPDIIPQDCIDLIERELPLNPDNVWKIFTEYKKREQECEQFLVNAYCSDKVPSLTQKEQRKYLNEYNENYFYNKIENDAKKHTIIHDKTKLITIAHQCHKELQWNLNEASDFCGNIALIICGMGFPFLYFGMVIALSLN